MAGATTLRAVVRGYPPAKRVRECALPQHRSDFGPRMLGRTRIGVACWLLRTRSAHAGRLHAQVAREGPPPARPCRQSSYRPESPNASHLVRQPPSSSQLRRLLNVATGEQRRLTLRSRADPPRQGALPGSRRRAILRLPSKAPCPCGPLSSNVRPQGRRLVLLRSTSNRQRFRFLRHRRHEAGATLAGERARPPSATAGLSGARFLSACAAWPASCATLSREGQSVQRGPRVHPGVPRSLGRATRPRSQCCAPR
jgi:hypothetical protein